MDPLTPKTDLKAEALTRLRSAILDGVLPPGASLAQAQLAERLGVSRQPISHALEVLSREGLVAPRGRRGLCVAPLDAQKTRDLYQARSVLDGLAAELIVARDAFDAPAAKALMEAAEAAAEAGDLTGQIDADESFHRLIAEGCGNAELARICAEQWPHLRRAMGAVLRIGWRRVRAWSEHRAIYDALAAGDAKEARRLAEEHCLAAGAQIAEGIAELAA